jgi:hypothetical protein
VIQLRGLLRERGGRGCLRGLQSGLGCWLLWGAGECFGQGFCDVGLAGPPEDLVVAQVAVVGDDLHIALGGLDEFDQVTVVIGQTHLCGPPYTPPCGVVRAHKSAENPRFWNASGCRDGRRKCWKFWPKGFDFCCGARTKVAVCSFRARGGVGEVRRLVCGAQRHTGSCGVQGAWHECEIRSEAMWWNPPTLAQFGKQLWSVSETRSAIWQGLCVHLMMRGSEFLAWRLLSDEGE